MNSKEKIAYSDVSRDVTPGSRGVVYFCGWQKQDVASCFLLNLLPKKRVHRENSVELLRNKFYKLVHNFNGNNFFRFPESEPKRTAWINQFVGGICPSARESALFTSCQLQS